VNVVGDDSQAERFVLVGHGLCGVDRNGKKSSRYMGKFKKDGPTSVLILHSLPVDRGSLILDP
jgi:hypothetical protein